MAATRGGRALAEGGWSFRRDAAGAVVAGPIRGSCWSSMPSVSGRKPRVSKLASRCTWFGLPRSALNFMDGVKLSDETAARETDGRLSAGGTSLANRLGVAIRVWHSTDPTNFIPPNSASFFSQRL